MLGTSNDEEHSGDLGVNSENSIDNSNSLFKKIRNCINKKKEICFLINQIEFYYEKSRKKGSYIDNSEIKEVFSTTLDYDVHLIIDNTTKELKGAIKKKLREVQDYHRHIVVFALSHANNNVFCTKDGTITFDKFVKLFQKNCPKPKSKPIPLIFFFNCCQGDECNISKKSNSQTPEKKSVKIENFFKIKDTLTCDNIFMGFSTVPGYVSLRDGNGSPYIQKLLKCIKENPELDVREIHENTVSEMSKIPPQKLKGRNEKNIQIPCFYTNINDHLYEGCLILLGKNSSIEL